MSPADSGPLPLGAERYISLTTFRRSGEPVSTPVWVAVDGDALVVTTGSATGKVTRLHHNPRVELRPCTRTGKVDGDAVAYPGWAAIITEPEGMRRGRAALRRKYGVQWRLLALFGWLAARLGRAGQEQVILRITPHPRSGDGAGPRPA